MFHHGRRSVSSAILRIAITVIFVGLVNDNARFVTNTLLAREIETSCLNKYAIFS